MVSAVITGTNSVTGEASNALTVSYTVQQPPAGGVIVGATTGQGAGNAHATPDLAGWQHNGRLKSQVAVVEAELAGQGRVLIRASGTEPVLRVMVEGRDAGHCLHLAKQLAEAAQS